MTMFKSTIFSMILAISLSACQPASEVKNKTATVSEEAETPPAQKSAQTYLPEFETLAWEDLMPAGEDQRLEELYAEFYKAQEKQYREQLTLLQAAQAETNKAQTDIMGMIDEGSELDTMEQIGTYNVVADLDGAKVRLPGYIVPLDFKASSEYDEFLLVPYFGACLHTPPPAAQSDCFCQNCKGR